MSEQEKRIANLLLWTESEDRVALGLYKEFIDSAWRAEELQVEEDRASWTRIQPERRSAILEGLIITGLIKEVIGFTCLPILIKTWIEDSTENRMMMTAAAARITGAHSQLFEKMVKRLNTTFVVHEAVYELSQNQNLSSTLAAVTQTFEAVEGWSFSYLGKVEVDGFDTFRELNKSAWRALALAVVLLETSDSFPLYFIFNEMERVEMSETLVALQLVVRDRSLITNYLSKIARDILESMSAIEVKELNSWISTTAKGVNFAWSETFIDNRKDIPESVRLEAKGFLDYNTNKALVKLGVEPIMDAAEMPALVEKYLNVTHEKRFAKMPKWQGWRFNGKK